MQELVEFQKQTPAELELARAYELTDNILMKKYLAGLGECSIVPLNMELRAQSLNASARFFKLERIIYDKEENNQEKLLNVCNALYNCGGSVIVLIKSDGRAIDFYLGTKSADGQIGTCQDVLKKAIVGNFPGSKLSAVFGETNVNALVDGIFKTQSNKTEKSISAVTSVAGFREGHTMKSGDFVQGLEKLIETARGEEFSLLILSKPIQPSEIDAVRNAYEGLYNQLLPFAATEITYGQNENHSITDSVSEGVSLGVTKSTMQTKTDSETSGETSGTSLTTGTSDTTGNTYSVGIGTGLSGALTAAASAAISVGTGGLTGLIAQVSGTLSGTLGTTLGMNLSANLGYARSNSHTDSKSETTSNSITRSTTTSFGTSETRGESQTSSRTIGQSITSGDGRSVSYQTHAERRGVKTLLERIDTQLKRLDECADLGMWECAAYVIADDVHTAQVIASNYKALVRGKNSGIESSAITNWNGGIKPLESRKIAAWLKKMEHPLLSIDQNVGISVTPAAVISGEELTVAAGLPQHSLPGLPVDNIARFGREVVYHRPSDDRSLNLGKIYHMGQSDERLDVKLNINALTAHTFVTGSTGSGKSTAVYKLLYELHRREIPWLVIEPAKGEYKDEFGGEAWVDVFGTNPYKVPNLLKLNPFSFPEDVHVLEHVDRLVEIFNACWPMYAAMPAILREAIERSYEHCGWSLKLSKNPGRFPTFETLLEILPKVVDSSAYSSDTSNDYKGALVTRVRSLTRGIHGLIFDDDLDLKRLLERASIIDLSRIGSQETKSLIMGVLVLKLQEFRMSEDAEANSGLRHVTVLEEAHNLLKRTSTEQSQEGSNVQGQSVAMLANAIAEMRTYGEGFVIADQSPSLMDMSVVRNTNTKIILRLPDESDRQLVGKAASLNDVQIEELSGLDRGVAAVFQSDWVEPVLCRIEKVEGLRSFEERFGKRTFEWRDVQAEAFKKFLKGALDLDDVKLMPEEVAAVRKVIVKLNPSRTAEKIFESVLNGKRLSESQKTILIDYALGRVISRAKKRSDALGAARDILISQYDAPELVDTVESIISKVIVDRAEKKSAEKPL